MTDLKASMIAHIERLTDPVAIKFAASALGVTPSGYDTSEDAGKPWPRPVQIRNDGPSLLPVSGARREKIRSMIYGMAE